MGEEPGAKAVDFDWLEAYANHDRTLVREVVTLFAAEAAEWAPLLVETADWRPLVHTIKGTSRSVGARALGDLCERAEVDGARHLPQVRAELATVLEEIGAYLARI
ncbi:MAG TPA: Hpt domain-containing protein [Caulobacteraceae bacterium]